MPFEQRISDLLIAYLPNDNLMTRRHDLKNVKRLRNESIQAFMKKLEFHIERTSKAYPTNIRQGRKENILEISLLKDHQL